MNKTYIIAEMACSHEGDIKLAKKIIDGAGEAGADAIQLQIWSLVDMMTPDRDNYELLKNIELTRDQWKEIISYSRKKFPAMEIYSFVYEHKSIDFMESLNIDGYKLSSADLSNPYMLEGIALTNKPINLSIGASTLEEIQTAIDKIKRISNSQINLMYGYQNFPTSIDDIHLNYMKKLNDLFEYPIGYQDHCNANDKSAFWVPAMSVGMGIKILEKHITHDRSLKGIDHESALNPDEFKEFVEMIKELELAKGISVPKPFSNDEMKYRKFQKKSIVASNDFKKGKILKNKDLNFLRAIELGLAPNKYEKLLNRELKRDIKKHQLIKEEDLK